MADRVHNRTSSRSWRKLLLMVVALLAFCFLAWFCNPFKTETPDLAQIERITRITFPPSARVLNGSVGFWEDVAAKIEIDKADVNALVRSVRVSYAAMGKAQLRVSRSSRHGMGTDTICERWWKPDDASRFIAVGYDEKTIQAGDKRLSMLIDLDDPRHAVVYLDYADD